jgi:hypothetical protein
MLIVNGCQWENAWRLMMVNHLRVACCSREWIWSVVLADGADAADLGDRPHRAARLNGLDGVCT